jgi:AhpC/TSA family
VRFPAEDRPEQDVLSFLLPGADGRPHLLAALAGPIGTVVVFVANGCPTARNYEGRLIALHDRWQPTGVHVVAVNSNNPSLSPPDTLQEMRARASAGRFTFPYLKDATGSLARRLGATCTPHAFVLERGGRVVYEGRIDNSRTGNTITSHDLADALSDVAAGRTVASPRTDPFGCSIIW